MKNQNVKKLIALLLGVSIVLNLCSCKAADKAGKKIADDIVDPYEDKIKGSSTTESYNPNGETLYEDVIIEDILEENVLLENQLKEQLLDELINEEDILTEDVKIEFLSIEVIDSVEQFDNDLLCEVYRTETYDFESIREQIAQGASMIICEVVIDLGSCILDIVFQQWGQLVLDLGQIVLSVGATSLSAYIASQVAFAKSLAAGNSYETALYDSLSSAADIFYFVSVVVNAVNTVISLAQTIYGIVEFAKVVKEILKQYKVIKSIDGAITLKKLISGNYKVVVDGKEIICDFAENSSDLYDITTKEYVCTLTKLSDGTSDIFIKTIPDSIMDANKHLVKFKIDPSTHELFRVTKDSAGNTVTSANPLGIIDEGGFVKNLSNQIIDRIDFNTGKSFGSYNAITKLSKESTITVDVFGNLVEISDTGEEIPLSLKKIKGVKTFLDSNNNAVMHLEQSTTTQGQWIKAENGRTVGKLGTEGLFDSTWKVSLNETRSVATKKVRNALIDYVINEKDSAIRKNFPDMTMEQIEYIREFKKLPEGFEIHHCYNVANYPDLAGDITNLEVMTSREAHIAAHNGNVQNPTASHGQNYVNLEDCLADYLDLAA